MFNVILFFIVFILILYIIYKGIGLLRPNISKTDKIIEYLTVIIYLFSFFSFFIFLSSYSATYTEAIDYMDSGYEPLANKHILGFYLFFVLFFISMVTIWIRNRNIPPLLSIFCHCFLLIGIFISVKIIFQLSITEYEGGASSSGFGGLPFAYLNVMVGMVLVFRTIATEIKQADRRFYQNKFLNKLNQILYQSSGFYPAVLLFTFPLYLFITFILILLGEDSNSMTKAFTETTTWAMSQKSHPPFLDHNGHYLCTVAACGSPNLVKPIFVGTRHQHPIIVNRQLQIANAFEEFIEIYFPKTHLWIRKNYDKYGYNLSIKINSKMGSNITYILMKPLEIAFLIFLYTVSCKPEELIKKQYLN